MRHGLHRYSIPFTVIMVLLNVPSRRETAIEKHSRVVKWSHTVAASSTYDALDVAGITPPPSAMAFNWGDRAVLRARNWGHCHDDSESSSSSSPHSSHSPSQSISTSGVLDRWPPTMNSGMGNGTRKSSTRPLPHQGVPKDWDQDFEEEWLRALLLADSLLDAISYDRSNDSHTSKTFTEGPSFRRSLRVVRVSTYHRSSSRIRPAGPRANPRRGFF